MKTNKKFKKLIKKTYHAIVITTILFLNLNCSKSDDEPNASIEAETQTFTLNGLNNCNTSSGTGSTLSMKIPYSISNGTTISKLQIKTVVADGGSESAVNTQLTDVSNTINWAICFRFGSQDWVEFEVVLEGVDGSKSNPTKVKVNKPVGAN